MARPRQVGFFVYRAPRFHARVNAIELAWIESDRDAPVAEHTASWAQTLARRESWAYALGRACSDPIFGMYLVWLPDFLTRRHGLARTSNTPGRTQDLNFFEVPEVPLFLVDMPGYGFADAPKAKVDAWTKFVKEYLRGRTSLKRVFVLVDSRHGIKPPDRDIFVLLNEAAVSFVGVLTKLDKLNVYEQAKAQEKFAEALMKEPAAFPRVVATSSEHDIGLEHLRAEIVVAAGLESLQF